MKLETLAQFLATCRAFPDPSSPVFFSFYVAATRHRERMNGCVNRKLDCIGWMVGWLGMAIYFTQQYLHTKFL